MLDELFDRCDDIGEQGLKIATSVADSEFIIPKSRREFLNFCAANISGSRPSDHNSMHVKLLACLTGIPNCVQITTEGTYSVDFDVLNNYSLE